MANDSIRIMCPNAVCKRVLSVPVTARGKTVRCRFCGTNIRIPSKNTPTKPEVPSVEAEVTDAEENAA